MQYNDEFTQDNYKEQIYKITKLEDFINIHPDLKIENYIYSLTEIPGLNDIYENYHLNYFYVQTKIDKHKSAKVIFIILLTLIYKRSKLFFLLIFRCN